MVEVEQILPRLRSGRIAAERLLKGDEPAVFAPRNAAQVLLPLGLMAGSRALADTHYMLCVGGGRAGLYYSAVFPVTEDTKSDATAKAFRAFVSSKYKKMISAECHRNATEAIADADKKIRENSDQKSRFPSKLIETGWTGK
ncbi:MAG TPA: hypothetical protein VKR31_03110 [Rhizomicrobium sp.]|nr:hypothetical protein [Rhizomicrobium sp.]